MNKITVRIAGGIGNQLFTYAAARRLSYVTGSKLIIDDISGFIGDIYHRRYQLDHFNIKFEKISDNFLRLIYYRYIFRKIRKLNFLFGLFKNKFINQISDDFDHRLLSLKVNGDVYIQGYWQSEKYFKDIENILRDELKILEPLDEYNKILADKISIYESVALHMRFFNSDNLSDSNNLSISYYLEAIDKMESLVKSKLHYFIFSNNIDLAKKILKSNAEDITFITNNDSEEMAYADLWLMSRCKYFIIANSTFSWWGAWLSNAEFKIVIAPKIRILGVDNVTSWGFSGLLPDDWIAL